MLVHKRTMGVLQPFWTGNFRADYSGAKVPVLETYTQENVPDFDPGEWWEVKGNTTLGRRLLRCYPFCDPVIGEDGELLDVAPWPSWKIYGEQEPVKVPALTAKTKQKRRRKLL